MNRRLHTHFRFWLVLALLVGAGARARAQLREPVYEEPQWLKLNITRTSLGLYSEGEYDTTSFSGSSGGNVTHSYYFVGPSLGLDLNGSVYHPNLLQYSFNSEGAVGWGWDTTTSGGTTTRRNEWQYLGWFVGRGNFLNDKPYHAQAFGSYDHSFRDYDFFNQVTVDSWRWGGRIDYEVGSWDFHADYTHQDDDISTISGPSTTHNDIAAFSARQERATGGTRLTYSYNHYNTVDLGQEGNGDDQTISIADNENFGSHDQIRLDTSASYSHRDTFPVASDEFLANANLNAQFTPTISSASDFSFDQYTSGGFESDSYLGQAQVQHKLYESLTSALVFRASDYETTDPIGNGYTRRYGGGNVESYIKNIGLESRLKINNAVFVDHTDQQSSGVVQNEPHIFLTPDGSFYLDFANVNESTIQITDSQHTQPGYVAGIDYIVIQVPGQAVRTQIQRQVGSRIPVGATVLVNYQNEPTPPGSYETLTESFGVRFELWNNLLGLYGRVDVSANNAPADLLVQNITAYTLGADTTWRWFRAGAEYQIYHADQSASYTAERFFQSATMRLDEVSTAGIDCTETFLDYTDINRTEDDYRVMGNYHRALSRRLSLDAAAGVAVRSGAGVDTTVATVRPALRYHIGKVSIDATYDYQYQLFEGSQESQQHTFAFRLKRVF